jgi:hypothetical protein
MISDLGALRAQPLFSMRLAVDGFIAVGGIDGEGRRIANVPGGSFEGPRLRGEVLPGGTDWQMVRGDGAVLLDARIILKTQEGALIAMTYAGIRHGSAEIMAQLGRGELVDPAQYYFRITARFETSEPALNWLNSIIAIGVGERHPEGPSYVIHELL